MARFSRRFMPARRRSTDRSKEGREEAQVLPEPPGTVVQEKDRQNVDPEKGENDNASVVESELGGETQGPQSFRKTQLTHIYPVLDALVLPGNRLRCPAAEGTGRGAEVWALHGRAGSTPPRRPLHHCRKHHTITRSLTPRPYHARPQRRWLMPNMSALSGRAGCGAAPPSAGLQLQSSECSTWALLPPGEPSKPTPFPCSPRSQPAQAQELGPDARLHSVYRLRGRLLARCLLRCVPEPFLPRPAASPRLPPLRTQPQRSRACFSLAGRPGPIQQILTGIHTQGFSNLGNINTFEDVYGWITGTYGPQVFPTVDQAAASSDPSAPTAYLGMPDRLYVSGHSRVLSALRIRQARPGWDPLWHTVQADWQAFCSRLFWIQLSAARAAPSTGWQARAQCTPAQHLPNSPGAGAVGRDHLQGHRVHEGRGRVPHHVPGQLRLPRQHDRHLRLQELRLRGPG